MLGEEAVRNVITLCFLCEIKLLQWALDDVIKVTQWEIQLFSLYCLESVDNSQQWTKESQWITHVSKVSAKLPSVLDFFFITEIRCQFTLKFRVLTNAFLLTRSPLFFFFLLGRNRAESGKQSSWHPWRLFIELEGFYRFMGSESHVTISVRNLLVAPCSTGEVEAASHALKQHLNAASSSSSSLSSFPFAPGTAAHHMSTWKGIIIMTLHLEVQRSQAPTAMQVVTWIVTGSLCFSWTPAPKHCLMVTKKT